MMRTTYIHDLTDWPEFRWDHERLIAPLAGVRHRQGRIVGRMDGLGLTYQSEALAETLSEDVVASSAVEGEQLNRDEVRSSIARRLGLDAGGLGPAGRDVEGVVEMTLDATQSYEQPLTRDRLFGWHAALFPAGRSGLRAIRTGAWRDDATGPMQVVSGAIGRERVHFEAPAAPRLKKEMRMFLDWFNAPAGTIDPVLKAGLAHLWFVTIHPFDDGNGRIARAITDLALARSDDSARRFYSMSSQILKERDAYYGILESTQKGSLDVTPWLAWFLGCLGRSIDGAESLLANVLGKAEFWQAHAAIQINDRQRLMLNHLLDGFEGKLTTSKWAKLTKSSQDTALRDATDLVEKGILIRSAEGGRSTSYALAPRS
jgi:Fic family protein